MTSGEAVFYDGLQARQRTVAIRFDQTLEIEADGIVLAAWPYAEIRRREAGPGILRLGSLTGPDLARLEIGDPALQAQAQARCLALDAEAVGHGTVLKIVGWSLAAAVSLVLTAIYLVPLAAERLAEVVPVSLERRLGIAVDNQVRAFLGDGTCEAPAGAAALRKLADALAAATGGKRTVDVAVLRSPVPNALALPGGRIYILDGLLRRAREPDEIAGVLAHEMGHVANRDGLKQLFQAGGTSFLLGLLFGDVTGGAAIVIATREMVDSAYSRDAERQADRFAADAMVELKRPPQPLGHLLLRITGETTKGIPAFLSSHPISEERLAALRARTVDKPGPPLLTAEEWAALKAICRQGGS